MAGRSSMVNRFVLLLSAVLLSSAGSPVHSQKAERQRYRLAFNVLQDFKTDDYEVCAIALDGTGMKNLTNDKDVAWTYDSWKDRLYFVSDRDSCKRCYFLRSMDATGNGVKKVSDLPLEDSWMGSRKGGTEIVVSGRIGKETRYQLFIMDVDSGKHRQLTFEANGAFRDPTLTGVSSFKYHQSPVFVETRR